MKIRLLTITHKYPSWVQEGYLDYTQRLPPNLNLELIEIPAEKRLAHADIEKIKIREGEKILNCIKPNHHVIALHVTGKLWSSVELSQQLSKWYQGGKNIDLIIGGPDGLSAACLAKAQSQWSLSPLTFPHILVRLILAEQLYRAWSILEQHPYHR